MEEYRKDLKQLVIVCDNEKCKEPIFVHPMVESSIKVGNAFICHVCFHVKLITPELQNYIAQTRCYQ